jgi:endonuclease YncB( thermonuclease family)
VPPLAHECSLAFIQPPRLEEPLGDEAAQTLRDLAWSQELFLKVQNEDKFGKLYAVLSRDPNELANTINGELVGRGLAKVTSAAKMQDSNPYLPHLVSREDPVRRRKAGLWGIESVDEEDYDY